MILNVWLNGKKISEEISADTLLIDFVRKHGCSSVKRGCDTSNCGLCTLFVEDKPVLSDHFCRCKPQPQNNETCDDNNRNQVY